MKNYSISIEDYKKEEIKSIRLILENCEYFDFFENEILEINLEFDENLIFSRGDRINRILKSGYLKIKINEKFNKKRESYFSLPKGRKHYYTKEIIDRFLNCCDICWIYITTKEEPFVSESIEVPFEFLEDEETGRPIETLVSSSAKLDSDGNIIIFMGELSEFKPNSNY